MPRASRSQEQVDRYLDLKVASATYRAEKRTQAVEAGIPSGLEATLSDYETRISNLEAAP